MTVTILRQGSHSPEVVDLQYLLLYRGGTTESEVGLADGDFGPKTKAATLTFQKNKGLLQDGIVGTQTWEALVAKREWPNEIAGEFLREGDRGEGVKRLQTGMKNQGIYAGSLDGDFGPITKASVLHFQRIGGSANVDGIVGPFTYGGATWH